MGKYTDKTFTNSKYCSDSSEKIIEQRAIKRLLKQNNINALKAKALSDLCIKPKKNEQYRIITQKQFNAYSLIANVIEDSIIDELYLAIYRINEATVNSIIDLIETNKIKKATFIISSFFNQTKKPEKWALILREYADTKDNVRHTYIWNHSKIVAIKSKNDYYVFEGSGNLSDNARIEQYVYENSKKMYDFHKSWMDELVLENNKFKQNGR